FGFASMLERTPHQTSATAVEETVCLEVSRRDILTLLERKPHAGMDMLTVLGKQFHASQQLVRLRAMRNANEVIEEKSTLPERIADSMVQVGGSWTFIIGFMVLSSIYTAINVWLRRAAWEGEGIVDGEVESQKLKVESPKKETELGCLRFGDSLSPPPVFHKGNNILD